jgi:hypothetical protein
VYYAMTYRDRHGQEETVLRNNCHELLVALRRVEFCGKHLDDFSPCGVTDSNTLKTFSFCLDSLCDCTFEFDAPLLLMVENECIEAALHINLTLGKPSADNRGGLDSHKLLLELRYKSERICSRGAAGDFEGELLDLQTQLPLSIYMLDCMNCAFSDYFPGGHQLFGDLSCFRDNKNGYRLVNGKQDLFAIWNTQTESVQETYLCAEFERRKPRTGYRG